MKNDEAPFLEHCRFCDKPRQSTQPEESFHGTLRLVCAEHWTQLWEEIRPLWRNKDDETAKFKNARWHRAVWAERLYEVRVFGEKSYLYRSRQADFARKRVEKALQAGKEVMVFWTDAIWTETLSSDIVDRPALDTERSF